MLTSTGLETIRLFGKEPFNFILGDYIIYVVSYLLFFYFFYFIISKKHLNKKKITYIIISGLLITITISLPVTYIYVYFMSPELLDLSGNEFLLKFGKYYFSFLETSFIFAVSGSLIKTAMLWYENVIKQKETERQLIAGEIALLKSQINPQFLLNTLTGIDNLIEISPEKAISSIENLSEIMSYMLYESSADKVLLDDEINYINNYLNLQRVSYNSNYIDFKVSRDASGISVPPLIFMPFIENAFKYGDGISQTPGVTIKLCVADNNLTFEVMNHIKENSNQLNTEDNTVNKSVKRRLDLIFGNNYSLETKTENDKYLIKLNIKLTGNVIV